MTTRRQFLAGLMASAAIGPAQAVPAQPVADFLAPAAWGSGIWGETPWSSRVPAYVGIIQTRIHQDDLADLLRGAQ